MTSWKTLTRIPGQTLPLNGWRTVAPPPQIKQADEEWVVGHRSLQEPVWYTEKAVMFRYYNWQLWIPIKAIVQYPDGSYSAAGWAIDSAKGVTGLHTPPDTENIKPRASYQERASRREKRCN